MSAEPRTSHEFVGYTRACPGRVWRALTSSETAWFLHGLSACSTWAVGDPVTLTACPGGARHTLDGVVLFNQEPVRLSYTIQAGDVDPLVCLTWQLRACADGCVITLVVDDLECPDTPREAESVWLPVLADLQRHLAGNRAGKPEPA